MTLNHNDIIIATLIVALLMIGASYGYRKLRRTIERRNERRSETRRAMLRMERERRISRL